MTGVSVLLLMTGGTIDANADYSPEKMAVPVGESNVRAYIQSALPDYAARMRFHQWPPMRDSREFSVQDIQEMAALVRTAPERMSLITHGTDAMAENARILRSALTGSEKTVILTGSMRPLSDGPQSDGFANLRFALARAFEPLPPGVYVAMPDGEGVHRLLLADDALQKHKDREVPYFSGTPYLSS